MGKGELTFCKECGKAQSTVISFPHSKVLSAIRYLLAIAADRWVLYSTIA